MGLTNFKKRIKYNSASVGKSTVFIHYDVCGDQIVKSAMVTKYASDGDMFNVVVYDRDSGICGRGKYDCSAAESVERAIDDMVRKHGLADLDWDADTVTLLHRALEA